MESCPTKVSVKVDAKTENDPGNPLTRSINGEIVEQYRDSQGTTEGGIDELTKNGSKAQDLKFKNSCALSRANNEAELDLAPLLSEPLKIAGKGILRDEIYEASKVISEDHTGNPKRMLLAADGSSQNCDPAIFSHGSIQVEQGVDQTMVKVVSCVPDEEVTMQWSENSVNEESSEPNTGSEADPGG